MHKPYRTIPNSAHHLARLTFPLPSRAVLLLTNHEVDEHRKIGKNLTIMQHEHLVEDEHREIAGVRTQFISLDFANPMISAAHGFLSDRGVRNSGVICQIFKTFSWSFNVFILLFHIASVIVRASTCVVLHL